MAKMHNGFPPDDDDPILEEIPIYLSKRMSKQLYVFQYPLLPEGSARVSIQKACVKPVNKVVKLDVAINSQSSNFDSIRAEDLARLIRNAEKDSKDKKKDKSCNSRMFSKLVYKSSKVMVDTSKYAIGVYNGKDFHITPLEAYIQLRPSLDFIDMCIKQKKKDHNDGNTDLAEASTSAQAVTVKFARNEIDKNLRAKDMTYKQLQEKIHAENWLQCKWLSNKNRDHDYLIHKLYCENMEDTGQLSMINKTEYLKLLVPDDQEQAVITPSLPSHVVSLHSLRSLPVQEQCRLLLKDTKMIQFQQLMLLLISGKGVTHEAVIKSLPQVAVLVRGNWVAKSEILYPQNSFSAISGVSAEQMCKARDYVLYQFTKHDFVERRKVSQTIRLPTEEVKEIFLGVARLRHNKGWELLLPEDTEFIAKHADIAERQKRLWENRWQQLDDYYKGCPKMERKRKKSRSIGGDVENKTNEARTLPPVKQEQVSDDADSDADKKGTKR
ncbi:DNA-directed RNA polymerase III subunit RPC5 isoform X1 [Atheta coriaria]|uniref:DNA-directed RNA polymerase III subunit RPC5 isoform X1 n=1 Tax=Dalotia coriaria TaxID=877792 RepID=UPI0031F35291